MTLRRLPAPSLKKRPRATLLNLTCHLGFSLEREGVVSHKLIEGQRLTSGEPLDVVGHATRFAFSIESLQEFFGCCGASLSASWMFGLAPHCLALYYDASSLVLAGGFHPLG